MVKVFAAVVSLVILPSCSPTGTIPAIIIGPSSTKELLLDNGQYEREIGSRIQEIVSSMLPRLQRRRARSGWHLDSVNVGLAAQAEAGIGAFEIQGSVGLYVTFERAEARSWSRGGSIDGITVGE